MTLLHLSPALIGDIEAGLGLCLLLCLALGLWSLLAAGAEAEEREEGRK